MALNNANFEADMAMLCDTLLAVSAQIERISAQRWTAANGANYEGQWNTPSDTPAHVPEGANATQSQMNNAISAVNSVRGAIIAASAALAAVAEYSPELNNNA